MFCASTYLSTPHLKCRYYVQAHLRSYLCYLMICSCVSSKKSAPIVIVDLLKADPSYNIFKFIKCFSLMFYILYINLQVFVGRNKEKFSNIYTLQGGKVYIIDFLELKMNNFLRFYKIKIFDEPQKV